MKRFILFVVCSFVTCKAVVAQQVIARPVSATKPVVAVLADRELVAQASGALKAYCEMLVSREGLQPYCVADDWQTPGQVKEMLGSIRSAYPLMEGAVLVGDIPVALIRNAQHMTTAFKMDELKFPIEQSSVASDRFYDDMDLSFRFLRKDSLRKGWFYYELEEEGPQVIRSDFYTGRIMSHRTGSERIEELRRFLEKAVAARNGKNELDQFLSFTGGAYNSESLTAWADEQWALRGMLPSLFADPARARMLHFSMDPKMKYRLFSELQRPGLDLALLTEHGDIEKQYINNAPSGDDFAFANQYLRTYLRTAVRKAQARGQSTDAVLAYYRDKYDVPASWFQGALDNDSLRIADSLYGAEADIITAELAQLRPEARMIIFNACYNGSYHHPNNISAGYLFGQGKTLVAHGNTTNVLQDKWTIKHLGLLQKGVRAGTWAMLNNTLESTLNGDPTWRFTPAGGEPLVLHGSKKLSYWNALLKGDETELMIALQKLADARVPGLSLLLAEHYKKALSASVRMQCLQLLSQVGDEHYRLVAVAALRDPYELIRRKSAEWMAKAGDTMFIRPLVQALITRPDDARVVFNISRCLEMFDWDQTRRVLQELQEELSFVHHPQEWTSQWVSRVEGARKQALKTLSTIKDPKSPDATRILAIRLLRNNYYHQFVPQLLPLIEDNAQPAAVRQNLVETLGWFSLSYQKEAILASCRKISGDMAAPEEVRKEALQTIGRLREWVLP